MSMDRRYFAEQGCRLWLFTGRMSLVREANTLQLLCVASTVLIVIDEEPEPLDHGEEGVVRALTRAVLVLPRLLDADLVREQQLALHEYQVLVHLSESPRKMLRMSDLAARMEL